MIGLEKAVRGLKRDAQALENNIKPDHVGSIIFKDNRRAMLCISRLVGRAWEMRELAGAGSVTRRVAWLFQFAVNDWAMLGSYAPEDWDWYRDEIAKAASFLVMWCDRQLKKVKPEQEQDA